MIWFMEEWWHGVERIIKPTLKGKWEIAGSGKQLDNVLKETRVVSIMELELLVTGANFINKKSGRPGLHQIRRQPKTERENHLTKRMENLLTKAIKSHVNGEIVPIRRVVTGTLPSVRTTFHKKDADMAKHVFFFDMLSWRKSPTRSRRKEVRMDQLQVREAHLSSDKVSADQTSDNINAKDNMMSPNWHLWRSRHLEKTTRFFQAKRLISLVRSAWFRPILDWLWRKVKKWLFQKVTSYL